MNLLFFLGGGDHKSNRAARDSKGQKPRELRVYIRSYFRSTDSFLQFCFDVKVGYGSPKPAE